MDETVVDDVDVEVDVEVEVDVDVKVEAGLVVVLAIEIVVIGAALDDVDVVGVARIPGAIDVNTDVSAVRPPAEPARHCGVQIGNCPPSPKC